MDILSKVVRQKQQPIKNVSFEDIAILCNRLSEVIKQDRRPFTSIYGIPRGGCIPAAMLSYKVNLPIVDASGINEGTIIVDDIIDSGQTIKDFIVFYNQQHHCNLQYIICMYRRHSASYTPILEGEVIADNSWIVFPWEV